MFLLELRSPTRTGDPMMCTLTSCLDLFAEALAPSVVNSLWLMTPGMGALSFTHPCGVGACEGHFTIRVIQRSVRGGTPPPQNSLSFIEGSCRKDTNRIDRLPSNRSSRDDGGGIEQMPGMSSTWPCRK